MNKGPAVRWDSRPFSFGDRATPNLPSRDFATTLAFYAALGFEALWRDTGWMILMRSGLQREFLASPDFDPVTGGYGSCLRLADVDVFYAVALATGVAERTTGFPRLQPPVPQHGLRIGAFLGPDGALLRLIGRGEQFVAARWDTVLDKLETARTEWNGAGRVFKRKSAVRRDGNPEAG